MTRIERKHSGNEMLLSNKRIMNFASGETKHDLIKVIQEA